MGCSSKSRQQECWVHYYILKTENRMFQTSAPDMGNVNAVIELLVEYGALKRPLPSPEQFVDPSYARDAHLPASATAKK